MIAISAFQSRQARATLVVGLSLGSLLAGCDPRVFEDLKDTTWVDSTGTPDSVASGDYGLGVAFGGPNPAGGVTFAVVGNAPGMGFVSYAPNGDVTVTGTTVAQQITNDPGQLNTINGRPAIAGDSSGNINSSRGSVALGITTDGTVLAPVLLTIFPANRGEPKPTSLAPGDPEFTAFAFGKTGAENLAGGESPNLDDTDLAFVADNQVGLVVDYDDGSDPVLTRCTLSRDQAYDVEVGELISDSPGAEIIVSIGNDNQQGVASVLTLFDAATILAAHADNTTSSCVFGARAELGTIAAPGGESDFGDRIVVADFDGSGQEDIAASAPNSKKVFIYIDPDLANLGTPLEITADSASTAFGTAMSAGDLNNDGSYELVVGDPNASPKGVGGAGSVFIYSISSESASLAATLHDSSPEVDQRFGRAVEVGWFVIPGAAALLAEDGGTGDSGVTVDAGTGADAATPGSPDAGSQTQPYPGRHVLAVGARREVFTYFRLPIDGSVDPRR